MTPDRSMGEVLDSLMITCLGGTRKLVESGEV